MKVSALLPALRSSSVAAERLPDDDTLPPPGWQPKSDFFKAIWAKAEYKFENPRITLTCPCCGEKVTLRLTFLDRD